MDANIDACQLAQLKARFDQITGQKSCFEEERGILNEQEYLLDLVIDAFFAFHPNISTTLSICYGTSKFIYRLVASKLDLQISLIDIRGILLETLNNQVELINTGNPVNHPSDLINAIAKRRPAEAIILESAMKYLPNANERKLILRKLYTSIIPGGSLWITNVLSINKAQGQAQNARALYLNHIGHLRGERHKADVNEWPYTELNTNLFQLFSDIKEAGFQRIELLYKRLEAMAIVAFK